MYCRQCLVLLVFVRMTRAREERPYTMLNLPDQQGVVYLYFVSLIIGEMQGLAHALSCTSPMHAESLSLATFMGPAS